MATRKRKKPRKRRRQAAVKRPEGKGLLVAASRALLWPFSFVLLLLNAVAACVLLLFRVPLVGRLLGQGVRLLQDLLTHLLNLPDLVLRLSGRRVRKVLRLRLVILRADGVPVVPKDVLLPQIETARETFAAAGVVLKVAAVEDDDRDAPAGALDVGSNARAWREDLWTPGRFFETATQRYAFHAAVVRLLGPGAPLFAFVVRSMAGGPIGCSLGCAADYVTLDAKALTSSMDASLLAHEVGHALGLLHRDGWDNLMGRYAGRGTALTAWQITVLRGSRHVTFF
jgi:hypothetical protein